MGRDYLTDAQSYLSAWRHWQSVWTSANLLIGGTSVFFGALVAANTNAKSQLFDNQWVSVGLAVAAPLLTFILTTLKPQAEAVAFKSAARELEKAVVAYKGDPSKDDAFLTDAVGRGIDLLNKVGGA
jgi:hypothetical protein